MDNHKISKLDHIHYTNFEIISLQISLLFMFLFHLSLCDCVLFTGKILIIGGGIANFTNVSATFKVNFSHLLLFKSPIKKRSQIAFNIANLDLS